jgi:hypothetical protein
MPLKRIGDLEIDEDIQWERGEWIFERIGWGLMALFVLIALAGLFGSGPISRRTAGHEGGPFWIDYNRFARYHSPEEMVVHIDSQVIAAGELRLVIEGDFLTTAHINVITPEPHTVELSANRAIYSWPVTDADGLLRITFHYHSTHYFETNSRLGLAGDELFEVSQFIFP